jgi:5'-nucleotidase
VGLAADATPGTDFHAVEQGTVSVTPLRLDLTQHSQLDEIRTWAEPLCVNV